MADVRHMYANLVRPSGLKFKAQTTGDNVSLWALKFLFNLVVRHRTAPLLGRHHRHLFTVDPGPAQRCVNHAGSARRHAPRNTDIGPQHPPVSAMRGKLLRQSTMRTIILCDHQYARSLFVQPVNNPRTANTADPRQALPAMRNQRVNQRTILVPGRRVHNKPCRLVDDNDVLILKQDIKRNILPNGISRDRFWHNHLKSRTRFDPVSRVPYRPPGFNHMTITNKRLHPRSAAFIELGRQKPVNALPSIALASNHNTNIVLIPTHRAHVPSLNQINQPERP